LIIEIFPYGASIIVPAGCAYLFSEISMNLKEGMTNKGVKICGSKATGPVQAGIDALISVTLVNKKWGSISDIRLGANAEVTIFNGPNFDGESYAFKANPTKRFNNLFFRDNVKLNDNTLSLILTSSSETLASC
jgi:hypothetical protein